MDMLTIGILMVLGLGLVLYSAMPRRKDTRDTVKRRLEGRKNAEAQIPGVEAPKKPGLMASGAPLLQRLTMPVSEEEQNHLRLKLAQAGYRHRQAQTVYLGSKSIMALVFLIAGVSIAMSAGYHTLTALAGAAVMGAGLGFLSPGFWLSSAISSRRDKIRRGLPDILDLLVVSIESGLALDAGIKRVGDEMAHVHPELAEEFRIATRETQMGIRRAQALDNMAVRVGLDELRALVSVIAQAERFGTSVAKALRTQSETIPTKRRQKAEEKAQQTAAKLTIPLVLFIFPAMGVVLAGPAAIRIFEAL